MMLARQRFRPTPTNWIGEIASDAMNNRALLDVALQVTAAAIDAAARSNYASAHDRTSHRHSSPGGYFGDGRSSHHGSPGGNSSSMGSSSPGGNSSYGGGDSGGSFTSGEGF
jgi:hypothetical protein